MEDDRGAERTWASHDATPPPAPACPVRGPGAKRSVVPGDVGGPTVTRKPTHSEPTAPTDTSTARGLPYGGLARITRIIDGLSRHDMVRKERHSQDARGSEAVLTDTGLRAMHTAQPAHLASARRQVLDHIPADLLPGIAATLAKLAEGQDR